MPVIRHIAWAALAAAIPAIAQTPPAQRAGEVVVTASRFPEAERGPALTVIDRRRIEESTAQTIVELLSQEAGIHVRDSQGSPDWSIDLRGFGQTGDQNTLVLVDGVRYSEIDTTPAKWSPIPLAAVEQVHVADRGATRAYDEATAAAAMREDPVRLRIRLGEGEASGWMWTSDLSHGYVDINAHYRS